MDDSEIIELFFARDEKAVSAAHEKYGRYCGAVANNILKNREDSEECVNDALMKAWECIPPERPRDLGAYLARLAKNISLNRLEASQAEKRGGGEVPLIFDELSECIPDSTNVERTFEQSELVAAVKDFLRTLKAPKRDLFLLRYWYCLSVSEAASRVGISDNNAAVTLQRTRKKLLEYLRKKGFHE